MRKIAKFLLLAMLISVFSSACGAVEEEVFDMDFTSELTGIDLEGYEMVYEFGLPSNAMNLQSCLGYEIDTPFGDMAAQRLKDVQEELNCKVTVNYRDKGVSCGLFVSASASGTFLCDAISGISDMWADVARIGMVVGLSELQDFIDYRDEEKWGYRNMLKVVYY